MKSILNYICISLVILNVLSAFALYYVDHDLQQVHTDLVNINATIQLIGA